MGKPGLSRFVGALVLAAFGQSAHAVILPPGQQNRVLLTWTSLGAGTQYTVETSTNLSTWTVATNTTETSANLSYSDAMRVFRVQAQNASPQIARLVWNASAPSTSVAGYRVYYGTASGDYTKSIDTGVSTAASIRNLMAGETYYFAVTAYSSSGLESGYSNEAVWKCPLKLKVQAQP